MGELEDEDKKGTIMTGNDSTKASESWRRVEGIVGIVDPEGGFQGMYDRKGTFNVW
jgi:hypothetical protein